MANMIRLFFFIFLVITSCGKKSELYIEGEQKEDPSIIFEERTNKF